MSLGGRALARGAQLPQPWPAPPGRRCPSRAAAGRQAAAPTRWLPCSLSLGVQQLEDVTDGDVGEHAALGGHDDRGPAAACGPASPRVTPGSASHERPQPGEPCGVAGRGHARASAAVVTSTSRQPPSEGRSDVGADRASQRRRQHVQPRGQRCPRAGQPARRPAAASRPPRASAPLASQRSCQVPPGWPASQSSSSASPGRVGRARRSLARQAAPASCARICSRDCLVAGQSPAAGRGGNRVRAGLRSPTASTRRRRPAQLAVAAVMTRPVPNSTSRLSGR